MIQCENICLSFSGKKIFENLNITINSGENVCISGPSGKGKSTLLNLLQGYILPDSGNISIMEQTLDDLHIKQIRENIALVPQNIHLSVKNGMELVNLMEITKKLASIKSYMEQLGLEQEIIEQDFSKISGGQKQRLIIAICLSMDKKILLMDEPTASLDDNSIKLLIETIKKQKGKTIVSASHNQLWSDNTDRIIEL